METRKQLRAPGAPVVLLLCAALLLSATVGHSDSRAKATVRVLVSQTTAALPFLLMASEQPLDGVDIRVTTFLNHPQALAMLLRGDADLLFTGTSTGEDNRRDGSPIVMINTGVWGMSFLVGKDPSIKGFADLKGKRLVIPFVGSPLDIQVRAILRHEGLDPDRDLSISYGPFAQSVPKLMAGQVDADALPEPIVTTLVRTKGLLRMAGFADGWARLTGGDGRTPQVSLFAVDSWAKDNHDLILGLVGAWRAASRRVTADPAGAAKRYAEVLGVEAGILEEATRNTLLSVPTMAENRAILLDYDRQIAKYTSTDKRPLDDKFFFAP